MPTATSLSAWTLINNGPLTTTFTAPSSCTTAYATLIAPTTSPTLFEWAAHCSNFEPPIDCNPSGSALHSIYSSAQADSNPTAGLFIVYHSPGIVCPAGWETVGAAKKVNPSSTSIEGAFNQSGAVPTGTEARDGWFEPLLDVVIEALDAGETAAVCCPSSYTVAGAGCYSTLPSSIFTPSIGCERILPNDDLGTVYGTWTVAGSSFSGFLETITATTPLETTTTTFAPSEATEFVGVAVADMFVLVYQSSDVAVAAAPSASKTGEGVRVLDRERGVGFVAFVGCLVASIGALLIA